MNNTGSTLVCEESDIDPINSLKTSRGKLINLFDPDKIKLLQGELHLIEPQRCRFSSVIVKGNSEFNYRISHELKSFFKPSIKSDGFPLIVNFSKGLENFGEMLKYDKNSISVSAFICEDTFY